MQHSMCFEDVQVGQELPVLEKGPLTTAHLMRWSAAIENWHKIHYDLPFATEHDKLPALLINGSLKQQFIAQLLKDWARPAGWVWKISFQFRAMNVVGETLEIWARVTELQRAPKFGLVHLELGIRGPDGKDSAPGTAVVVLPYRNGLAVPYPFVPPAEQEVCPA
ncbi:acyl dehydratase [Diaphorobacter sp. HDW4A]|uniref:acyl dehydratase n=1 Tax=Diaphorobacter sp. HDW4A TaxID=2714924 RepID=UPI00140C2AA0|nr:acyl dehydratase [Diaphorobacter sp. HDW4A]QIL80013.1 acyl dehydratase [Diaphorobacter sp. HDW4A]